MTTAERTRLQQTMKRTASARLYRRLQAALLAGEGHPAAPIAAVTGASVRSVQSWCAAWRGARQRRHPQEVLAEQPRLGRHPVAPALDRARLLSELAKDPLALGYAATNWAVPLLAMVYVHRQMTRVESPLDHTLMHAQGLLVAPPMPMPAPPPPPLALPFPLARTVAPGPAIDAVWSDRKTIGDRVEALAPALRSKGNPSRV